MTVKELMQECKAQIANGNGNKEIWISNDEEGNGFHNLFYTFDADSENYNNYLFDFSVDDMSKIIILG